MHDTITAIDVARSFGIDPKRLRAELRRENFRWHRHQERWVAARGSDEHRLIEALARRLARV